VKANAGTPPVRADPVQGEVLEIAKRRHASAKVIEGDAAAGTTQAFNDARYLDQVANCDGLGDLKAKLLWRTSVFCDAAKNEVRQALGLDAGA